MIRFKAMLAGCVVALAACSQSNATSTESAADQAERSSVPDVAKKKVEKFDGPFGLKMGLNQSQAGELISNLKPKADYSKWSSAFTVPVPHAYFESYLLQFSDKSGLCAIVGIGKDIQSGSTGADIRSQFDSLDEALTSKYGTGKKYDFSSERYDSPEFWMLHMLQKNRTLAKSWDKESKATLSNNISSVLMQAHARDINTGLVYVRYEFDNIGDCDTEEKAKKNEGL